MPEMPAPTISTSKCSDACADGTNVLRAAATFMWLSSLDWVDASELNCPPWSSSRCCRAANQTAFDFIAHDPEKWVPVFRQDQAPTIAQSPIAAPSAKSSRGKALAA